MPKPRTVQSKESRGPGTPSVPARAVPAATRRPRRQPPGPIRPRWPPPDRSDRQGACRSGRPRGPEGSRDRRVPRGAGEQSAASAMRTAARSAIAPNTPSAMEIGFNALSALATTGARAWSVDLEAGGVRRPTSRSTSGTVLAPPVVVMPKVSAPEKLPMCQRLAGEGRRKGDERRKVSTSSSTISEFNEARPTSFMFTRSAGGTAWSRTAAATVVARIEAERDHLADVEPEELGHNRCHDDLVRTSGTASRPWFTTMRSWEKKSPLTLATGKASPVTRIRGRRRRA